MYARTQNTVRKNIAKFRCTQWNINSNNSIKVWKTPRPTNAYDTRFS